MWNEHNCMAVWPFSGIALLWDWNEYWPFPVLWPLLSLPNLLTYWVQHSHSLTGVRSPAARTPALVSFTAPISAPHSGRPPALLRIGPLCVHTRGHYLFKTIRHLGCLQVLAITNKPAMNIRIQDCWWTQHSYLLRLLPGLLLAKENIRNSAGGLSCYASTENAGWCNLEEDKVRGSRSLRIKDRKQDPFLGGWVGNWDHKRFQKLGRSLSTNWTENTWPGLGPPEPASLGFSVKYGKQFLWAFPQPRPLSPVLLGLWWWNVRASIRVLHVPGHFLPVYFIPVIQTGHFTFSPHIHWLFSSVLSAVLSNQSSELFHFELSYFSVLKFPFGFSLHLLFLWWDLLLLHLRPLFTTVRCSTFMNAAWTSPSDNSSIWFVLV